METAIPGEIWWFIHPQFGPVKVLGLVREHRGGAYVFGGHTGSHSTGHGEKWEQKLALIESQGYIRLEEARKHGLIQSDWEPPEEAAMRDSIVNLIQSGKL